MPGTINEPARARKVRFGGMETPRGYVFELTGGRPCLDLANTLDERRTEHPRELLRGFDDVVDWAVQAGLVAQEEGERLRRDSAARPGAAAAAVRRVTTAREVIFSIFSAIARGQHPSRVQVEALNARLAEAYPRRQLESAGDVFRWSWREADPSDLDRPLWAAVLSAADLLTSDALDRVRQCEGVGCAWLFMDASKNGSRRWCDMSVCGNRAKARRHRSRVATGGETEGPTPGSR